MQAVEQLFAVYTQALDDRRFENLESVLAEEVEFTFLNGAQKLGPLHGFAQAAAFIRRTVEGLPGRRTHQIRNLTLMQELPDGARVHASLLRTIYRDEKTVEGHSRGSYEVDLSRDRYGRWRFQRVLVRLDDPLPGDIER